jgi:hypothetical protein
MLILSNLIKDANRRAYALSYSKLTVVGATRHSLSTLFTAILAMD